MVRLVLFEPDIPQNAGSLIRLTACLGLPLEVVEPCGFLWDDRRLRRAGLDYHDLAQVTRHASWRAFREARPGRLVLLTTRARQAYCDFAFAPEDMIMVGRESAGVPDEIHALADARLCIPMRPGLRSLNVAIAAAMVAGEAIRQLDSFPRGDSHG